MEIYLWSNLIVPSTLVTARHIPGPLYILLERLSGRRGIAIAETVDTSIWVALCIQIWKTRALQKYQRCCKSPHLKGNSILSYYKLLWRMILWNPSLSPLPRINFTSQLREDGESKHKMEWKGFKWIYSYLVPFLTYQQSVVDIQEVWDGVGRGDVWGISASQMFKLALMILISL